MKNTYTWIYNIIESCNNDFHFDCVDVLITLFNIKYGDDESAIELRTLRQAKWNVIHAIII